VKKEPVLDGEGKEVVLDESEVTEAPKRPNDPHNWDFWNEKCYVRVS